MYPSFDISLVDGAGVVLYIFQVLIGVRVRLNIERHCVDDVVYEDRNSNIGVLMECG